MQSKRQLLDEMAQVVQAKARNSLLTYSRLLDPNFAIGPHHRLIASKLEALERGEITRLIISMPPRSGKSLMGSTYFPSWAIGRNPSWEILTVSYASDLAEGFGREVRNIIEGEVFKMVFPDVEVRGDSRSAGRWHTNRSGVYNAGGVFSGIAGKGANLAIIDDPISEQEADSKAALRKVIDWYPQGLLSRLMPNGRILIIMTRWSSEDLAGWLLEQQQQNEHADKWEVLRIPAILEPGYEKEAEALNLKIGDCYWPQEKSDYTPQSKIPYKTKKELLKLKANLPPRKWECLYQQNPVPSGGQVINIDWFRRWEDLTMPDCFATIMSLDTAYGTKQVNDYSVLQTWGLFKKDGLTNVILLSQVKGRFDFPTLCNKVLELASVWEPGLLLIEKRASGQSLSQTMALHDLPLQEISPDKDKVSRAHSASVFLNSGRVWIPFDDFAEDFLAECELFGTPGVHDDAVDAMTQFINFIVKHGTAGIGRTYKEEDDEDSTPDYKRYW